MSLVPMEASFPGHVATSIKPFYHQDHDVGGLNLFHLLQFQLFPVIFKKKKIILQTEGKIMYGMYIMCIYALNLLTVLCLFCYLLIGLAFVIFVDLSYV